MKVDSVLRYKDSGFLGSDITDCLPEKLESIIHSETMIGEQRFRMSDGLDSDPQRQAQMFLAIVYDTDDEAKRTFDVLAEDGEVLNPLTRYPFSSIMGDVVDKFGIKWRVMT